MTSTLGGSGLLHTDALEVLSALSPTPGEQERLRDRFVTHLRTCPDGVQRSCHPDHLTAGVVVLSADLDHVLLNLHRKANRWFHFGGHCEPGDATLVATALREGLEESGLEHLDIDPVPVHLDEHAVDFCGDLGRVNHLDVRFTALTAPGSLHAVSDESLDVRWWAVESLPSDLDDDMHVLVAAARQRWALA